MAIFLCSASLCVNAQYSPPVDHAATAASSISADVISKHLHVLASPAFEGRETGTPGNAKAAQYIADQFAAAGIPKVSSLNSYFQEVAFSNVSLKDVSLSINGTQYAHLKDFIVPAESLPENEIQFESNELIFLGYGIDDKSYSDYAGKSLAGKAIMIYKGEPVDENGKSWVTGSTQLSEWSASLDMKLRAAAKHQVALVYVIEDQFRSKVSEQRMFALGGQTVMGIPEMKNSGLAPHVLISSNSAGALMSGKSEKVIRRRDKIRAKGKPRSMKIPVETKVSAKRTIVSTPGVNVLAYIEGTDPVLKDQVVVVSAHYDHLGKRGDDIFYGADDNASGTSAVIAIASAFAEAKRQGLGPRRSVLCMLVTGEEKGLLGSEFYVEFPVFPLENTVANVNIDMIGRSDDKHENRHYTYVIGADRMSTELHDINEAANEKYTQLELDYTYNAENDPNRYYYRSDHYNFAKNGIPIIFYFSGAHEDYHRPTDTPDKIMFDRAASIAQLAFHTTWELVNRDGRIKVDKS